MDFNIIDMRNFKFRIDQKNMVITARKVDNGISKLIKLDEEHLFNDMCSLGEIIEKNIKSQSKLKLLELSLSSENVFTTIFNVEQRPLVEFIQDRETFDSARSLILEILRVYGIPYIGKLDLEQKEYEYYLLDLLIRAHLTYVVKEIIRSIKSISSKSDFKLYSYGESDSAEIEEAINCICASFFVLETQIYYIPYQDTDYALIYIPTNGYVNCLIFKFFAMIKNRKDRNRVNATTAKCLTCGRPFTRINKRQDYCERKECMKIRNRNFKRKSRQKSIL